MRPKALLEVLVHKYKGAARPRFRSRQFRTNIIPASFRPLYVEHNCSQRDAISGSGPLDCIAGMNAMGMNGWVDGWP